MLIGEEIPVAFWNKNCPLLDEPLGSSEANKDEGYVLEFLLVCVTVTWMQQWTTNNRQGCLNGWRNKLRHYWFLGVVESGGKLAWIPLHQDLDLKFMVRWNHTGSQNNKFIFNFLVLNDLKGCSWIIFDRKRSWREVVWCNATRGPKYK